MTSTTSYSAQNAPRPLHIIAREIARYWPEPFYGARPYIDAMRHLADMTSTFGHEDAEGIVLRFLSNAGSWRGPEARRIKAELKGMLPRRSAR